MIALGFDRIAVPEGLSQVRKDNASAGKVEDLIKAALKALA